MHFTSFYTQTISKYVNLLAVCFEANWALQVFSFLFSINISAFLLPVVYHICPNMFVLFSMPCRHTFQGYRRHMIPYLKYIFYLSYNNIKLLTKNTTHFVQILRQNHAAQTPTSDNNFVPIQNWDKITFSFFWFMSFDKNDHALQIIRKDKVFHGLL